jgi:hypothetical protein
MSDDDETLEETLSPERVVKSSRKLKYLKYRHLISLTAKTSRKSFTRRIKTVITLGSIRWMWIKLLGGYVRNAVTSELKPTQMVGRDAEQMNALLGHRSSTGITKTIEKTETDQVFLKTNRKQLSPSGMPSRVDDQHLPKGTLFTNLCLQCNEWFYAKEARHKRCGSCQAEWRKTHPYVPVNNAIGQHVH